MEYWHHVFHAAQRQEVLRVERAVIAYHPNYHALGAAGYVWPVAQVAYALNYAAYFVSKAAIPGLTRCLAVELGTRNPKVRVNCILPGPVMLPPDLSGPEKAESIAGTLVRHEGRPENVAQAVLALIDNDFITGACLPVDGGRTVYAPA